MISDHAKKLAQDAAPLLHQVPAPVSIHHEPEKTGVIVTNATWRTGQLEEEIGILKRRLKRVISTAQKTLSILEKA